jgi:hypothetical protein
MKKTKIHLATVAVVLLLGSLGIAEDKSPDIPLRMTVVLNEYDGNTKVSSLPYIMPCKATRSHEPSSLRMGFQVPYTTGEQIQYRSVGTNIDCGSEPPDEKGGYMINLGVEHEVVYRSGPNGELHPGSPGNGAPVTGGIHATLRDLLLHDGQTANALTATDPVSGHVWKVEVTLNVVK